MNVTKSAMEGLPLDVFHTNLCAHLDVYDLCRLMCCSKHLFFACISEPAFAHIKTRILREIPEFQWLYDKHPWRNGQRLASIEESKAKKCKKVWIMPRGGTWYMFKAYFRHLWSFEGLKILSKLHYTWGQCLVLNGLKFAFELTSIRRQEYRNLGRNYHFRCNYQSVNGKQVAIEMYHKQKHLHINACDRPARDDMMLTLRGQQLYLMLLFQFWRIQDMLMGRPFKSYANVLKDVLN